MLDSSMNVSDGTVRTVSSSETGLGRRNRNKDSPMSSPFNNLIDNLSKLRTIEARAARTFIGTEIEENKVFTPLKGLRVKKQASIVKRECFYF